MEGYISLEPYVAWHGYKVHFEDRMASSVNSNIESFIGDWRGPFLAKSHITSQQGLGRGDKEITILNTTEGR